MLNCLQLQRLRTGHFETARTAEASVFEEAGLIGTAW